MTHLLKQSWLHFLVLGSLLYNLQLWHQPPELPVIYQPGTEKVAELRGQWLRTTGKVATAQQIQQLVDNQIDQEILFQEALKRNWHISDSVVQQRLLRNMLFLDPQTEQDDTSLVNNALAMKLHENDLVIRRRLIQRMEMQAFAKVRRLQPGTAVLRQLYHQQSDSLLHPARISLRHVFVSRDRHDDPQQRAQQLVKEINSGPAIEADYPGDPFLHGLHFNLLSRQQLARYFGADFASQLFQQLLPVNAQKPITGQWLGPISSSFGEHLVRVDDYRSATPKSFAEVEKMLLAQWRREQEQLALQSMIRQLRSGYSIAPALSTTVSQELQSDV